MNNFLINRYITNKRFSTYENMEAYTSNLKKSKQLYIPLSVLEISLRNAINDYFDKIYGAGWLINEAQFLHQKELEKISHAKDKLRFKKEEITKDKLVAELTFGFWTGLFKTLYDNKMRFNNLKQIFPNLPSFKIKKIDRKIMSSKLNHIRTFRNRVFHHENINKEEYYNIEDDIYEILTYFDDEVCEFAKRVNNE